MTELSSATEIEIEELYPESLQDYSNSVISVLDINDLEYNRFHKDYLLKNVPCLIKNVSTYWQCSTKWVSNNKINTSFLSDTYNDIKAPVADCNATKFNSQCKTDMSISDYMSYLNGERKQLLYLKDWHLRRTKPDDQFYSIPSLFASDWLNEYALDKEDDDFMFVYIGPKDSWTQLHADVYNSYSWSVNVVGQKNWILFPPGEEDKLKNSLGNLPLLFKAEEYPSVKFFEVMQNKGDAIFVPSGWHHQVENTLDTISVNHNWINGCNIQSVWSALQEALKSVELEIKEFEDTPEYVQDCQTILNSLFGMDYASFLTFLMHIARKRLQQSTGHKYLNFNKFTLGSNQIRFDLTIIMKVFDEINSIPNFFHKYLLSDYKDEFIILKDELINTIKAPLYNYVYISLIVPKFPTPLFPQYSILNQLFMYCLHLSLQFRFAIYIHMSITDQLFYLILVVFQFC